MGQRHEHRLQNFDAVICGNTSVIGEAVGSNVVAIYCSKLDTYSYDLCGYVGMGLVPDATNLLPSWEEVEAFFGRRETKESYANHREQRADTPQIALNDLLWD
jgi:hypothetical protein